MDTFTNSVLRLYYKTPRRLWETLVTALEQAPTGAQPEHILQKLPVAMDADLSRAMQRCLEQKPQALSWQALSHSMKLMASALAYEQKLHSNELLWTGPDVEGLSLRHIDQALYDGLDQARERILLVTFAATRIAHLNSKLEQAISRDIPLRLVLEFSNASQGQLRFDAARAFSAAVKQHADIYCWAADHRLRNKRGDPAKLHAKFAVIDNSAYISSANLTGDAFERNIELGVVMFDKKRADELWQLVDGLVARGVFQVVQ
jgi:phosphatidylserine/phosphatidylglycerophosphate/cardiolipin synthase-like enzyme